MLWLPVAQDGSHCLQGEADARTLLSAMKSENFQGFQNFDAGGDDKLSI